MDLTTYLHARTFWVASWLLAGALVLLIALVTDGLPLSALAALYFGLGAGVELTLFIQGRRTVPERPPLRSPVATAEETVELVRALRALGLRQREATEIAERVPGGLPFDRRMELALRHHGEEVP